MKKIMFNERYGLNNAVLIGRKTMTRRIAYDFRKHASNKVGRCVLLDNNNITYKDGEVQVLDELSCPQYQVGEVVAIAQNYKDAGLEPKTIIGLPIKGSKTKGILQCEAQFTPGWSNKMFVRADLMRHYIRITNIQIERLQDISDEDCLAEGIYKDDGKTHFNGYAFQITRDQYGNMLSKQWYSTPREAFAALIDRISGKGTWESNPYVFAYEFELVD